MSDGILGLCAPPAPWQSDPDPIPDQSRHAVRRPRRRNEPILPIILVDQTNPPAEMAAWLLLGPARAEFAWRPVPGPTEARSRKTERTHFAPQDRGAENAQAVKREGFPRRIRRQIHQRSLAHRPASRGRTVAYREPSTTPSTPYTMPWTPYTTPRTPDITFRTPDTNGGDSGH